jgi:signal transduction histidine kinase
VRSLYLRIYLTVVLALGLFALVSGWLVQSHLDQERVRSEGAVRDRVAAWVELLQRSLPGPEAALDEQAQALREWSVRLRLPMALDDAGGSRIAASEAYLRREAEEGPSGRRGQAIKLDDGRTLWVMRPGGLRNPGAGGLSVRAPGAPPPWWAPPRWFDSLNLAALLLVMFAAVAGGAWPVVRRLTRRLETLKSGVEAFGAGALNRRVPEEGRDEVAALATSFNQAASRIETLVKSHQSLLANASHEIRSPLARLKMAVSMMEDAPPEARAALRQEIDTNIGELDALVEEVLMASRLDAKPTPDAQDAVDLLGLAAEEASRVQAQVQGDPVTLQAEERLVRRALRNLLENARRYGGDDVEVSVSDLGSKAEVRVSDRGPGVPAAFRERIFEAFFRLPGHAEREGGVGLGLALVRQIAQRHGGGVRCEPREGGGSCFVLTLPRGNPA